MRGKTFEEVISIHAPYAGSDIDHVEKLEKENAFQSTLPMQGATIPLQLKGARQLISIHAPYAGSDRLLTKFNLRGLGFVSSLSTHALRKCFFLTPQTVIPLTVKMSRSDKRVITRSEQLEPVDGVTDQ